MKLASAIQELHDRCAIYTSTPAAARLLDLIGWTEDAHLSESTLLEPCVGEGAILLEGIRRLLANLQAEGRRLSKTLLLPRIRGFELHPGATAAARRSAHMMLMQHGMEWGIAKQIAHAWVVEADYLLATPGSATHIVANPPYVRWSKLPPILADQYRAALPEIATRGDLAVAFLHRMQEWAGETAIISALVSDRWMFTQYGAAFVAASAARGWQLEVVDERPDTPFVRSVGAYSAIVRFSRNAQRQGDCSSDSRSVARRHHADLLARHGSLADAGCIVRVGPALGAGKTYLLDENEATAVEPELIRFFVAKSDLAGDAVGNVGRRVVVPYDRSGTLIDPDTWPGFAGWAQRHKALLQARSQFVGSDRYWRTIDAVPAIWAQSPKLLMAELSNCPRAIVDRTDSLPAHSIYAIWPGDWPIEVLQRVLNAGLLMLTAVAEAPRLEHGWMRFYKRFIMRTPLPRWKALDARARRELAGNDAAFARRFATLFGFEVGKPPIE